VAFDRHRLWREVQHIYAHLEQHPREGFQPVVEAFTSGREKPVVVAVAETRRDPDYPWIKLYTGDDDGGYVFVHEDHLERVEVTYKSTEVASAVASAATAPRYPTGFRASEIAADDGGSAE
jgi:hypothetical protein